MPGYSPLPRVDLDPRNEGQLVQAAARRIYEASNATLNDFSSGSPIVALLEGQAFSQAEFLQFANQFPESVLIEWIGPFLGAQRRTGSGAIVDITFTITPRDDQFDVFEGYQVATNPNLTGGESVPFVTIERLVIPAGQSTGTVRAISVYRSSSANVPSGTITKSLTSLAGVESIVNLEAASGGQDPELLSEVKERFFSLIRRRNPVSSEDWGDFFRDALGSGAVCTVLPRRSEKETYRYENDYVTSAPAVAFFVLNPDGSPLTTAQRGALNNLIRWSLPVEFLGHVYSMEVNDVDFNIELQYDPGKPYAQDLSSFTETVRSNLFAVMQPNAVFPVSYDQSVNDVESALTSTFPLTLGTTNQYLDPDVSHIKAYVSPVQISNPAFILQSPQPFKSGDAVQRGDLVVEQGNVSEVFYEALESFTPELNDKTYHVNANNLEVELIKPLTSGEYDVGDVLSVGEFGDLHIVLTPFTYRETLSVEQLISQGFLSSPKSYSAWELGKEYSALDENGAYDPQIIKYEQSDSQFNVFIPSLPADLPYENRAGSPVYVVNQGFTLTENTTTLSSAQTAGLVTSSPVTIEILTDGQSYTAGSFVKTPDPSELLSGDINRENCFINRLTGAQEVYAKVSTDFTFDLQRNYVEAIDVLIADGILDIVQRVPFIDCKNESSFSAKPFRYSARFRAGEYVRFRETGGYSAEELESCTDATANCSEVSDNCRKLFEQNLELPRYFFVLKDFTPNSADITKLIEAEYLEEVSKEVFTSNYIAYVPTTETIYSDSITQALIKAGDLRSVSDLNTGDTCQVVGDYSDERALYEWRGSLWVFQSAGLPVFRDLFRFAPGDVASFRSNSETRSYVARQHVTPMLEIEVYYDNGVFERTALTETVKWIDPNYHLEDVITLTENSSTSFFRCIRSFTPPADRTIWNGTISPSTPRIEEIYGNCLKFVNQVDCSEALTSRLRDGASTTKLGRAQINVVSKTAGSVSNTFVWEATQQSAESPQLSSYPNSTFGYGPVDYGTGTLAL